MRLRKALQHGLAAMLALLLGACGGAGAPGVTAPSANGTVSLNLYPSSNDGRRLFLLVNGVGGLSTRIPVALDTGSAGLTLYAPDIFPADMVDAGGFKFPAGADTLSYQGITVTKLGAVRLFGGASGRTQVGNLGFATVSFGDASASVATESMPVLFYYEVLDTATQAPVAIPVQHGWFGVHDGAAQFTVAGSLEPPGGYAACDTSSTGTCYAASVLKYVKYPASVHAGFLLDPATLQDCSIAAEGSCTPQGILTLGITSDMKSGFNTEALQCPPVDVSYPGPKLLAGYEVCQSYLEGAAVTVGSGIYSFLALFDSGTPYMAFSVPAGSNFPDPVPQGEPVTLTLPSGFQYGFNSGPAASMTDAPYATSVVHGALTATVIGIDYFTTNSFYIDYNEGTEGFK